MTNRLLLVLTLALAATATAQTSKPSAPSTHKNSGHASEKQTQQPRGTVGKPKPTDHTSARKSAQDSWDKRTRRIQ